MSGNFPDGNVLTGPALKPVFSRFFNDLHFACGGYGNGFVKIRSLVDSDGFSIIIGRFGFNDYSQNVYNDFTMNSIDLSYI